MGFCFIRFIRPHSHSHFRAVTRSYYRGAAGALLVYDISNRESYNSLTNWLTDARTLASPNICIVLVGNKKDLEGEREVTFMEASRFAQENGKYNALYPIIIKPFGNNSVAYYLHNCILITFTQDDGLVELFCCFLLTVELSFLETSALTGENVEEVFLKCARSILTKIDAGWLTVSIYPYTVLWKESIIFFRFSLQKVNWTQTEWDLEFNMGMQD